ncbi:trans-sulfuration enzyme family protein [Inhella gelatinilytica]|uniref:Aminotransferase class I/II-fold pyridoxal phosphate-dependent enzyme n=1 Tax=Inhella gelatinilytica TaxID=2795030 RepID=A0A931IZ73_9BURK|nr:aminotransferase class I/II-fold pyridoxal phosphate-dependent enzyme [Inhella gelatinilytica]MBH9554306.1 aminotransferase class I/II-fold pyridoxal phosphate-dependent enzyme [Inhella gelatinilytica]
MSPITTPVGVVRGDPASASPLDNAPSWTNELARERLPGPFIGHPDLTGLSPSTLAVHAGTRDDPATGAVGTPIYQTSTFLLEGDQYRSIEEGYARDRFIYTRYGNPSQWAVEQKLAALEGAESALVFSSGMAAISAVMLTLMDRGGHVVASNELYGGTYAFFQGELPTLGMSCSYVNPRDLAAIEAAIRPNTQVLFFEALTNPLLKVVDVPALVALAQKHGLRLVIDATFVSPIAQQGLALGVDVVVHSASKYLNGHSDLIAGVACGSRKLMDACWPRRLSYGGSLDPHACFMLERGLKTLAIRMRAHAESSTAVAQFLEQHPNVRRVFHVGLPSHPDHELAQRILKNPTGMVCFEIDGTDEQAVELLDHLKLGKKATSLGGVETLVSLPFNTSHAAFTAAQRERMGIQPGCVRLSVGIEEPADLIADLNQALAAVFN